MRINSLFKVFYILIIFLFIFFSSLTAYSVLHQKNNLKLFVVQSGSMEPTIKTGSIVIVNSVKNQLASPVTLPLYQPGEIITFLSGKETITHRIIEREFINQNYFYQTKGDANQTGDIKKVKQNEIIGKVVFYFPYLGHLVAFSRSQQGFILLIVIPSTIIIYSEILKIKKEIKKYLKNKRKQVNLI